MSAEDQIRDLIHVYCYLLDNGRGEEIPQRCFTEDAIDDHGVGVLRGRGEMTAFFHQDTLASTTGESILEATAHTISNHIVRVDGDTARSHCYITGWHWMTATSHLGALRESDLVLVAIYDDHLVRTPDGWRITERHVRRIGPGLVGIGNPHEGALAPVVEGITSRLGSADVPMII